ncbi:MAG: acyl-CoA desaturase [Deltaproteobacteria bacterium]|jgi:stearoyl-CoA desaturase (delta-9 desaturase)|nr:acyl-CoA desaturase [Deltaproteobacteria bacterium]
MLAIALFFVGHWLLSVFFQTFFLHRYGAHRQFSMSRRWERIFYLATWLAQGASFLSPRGYAILHREHHAFSDTAKDPHSPHFQTNPFAMMLHTKKRYSDLVCHRVEPEPRFAGGYPEWAPIDRIGNLWSARLAFGAAYTLFYVAFAPSPIYFALLPVHFLMGPIHGAIVNWCGHKYGYRNFATNDLSRNTLPFDLVTLGELFQNNHHKAGMAPNFAVRWFEIDPAYLVIRTFAAFGIVQLAGHDRAPETPEAVYPASSAQPR